MTSPHLPILQSLPLALPGHPRTRTTYAERTPLLDVLGPTGGIYGTGISARPASPTPAAGHAALRLWLTVFLLLGAFYPLLRVELLEHTRLPSPVLGAWVDLVSIMMIPLLFKYKHPPVARQMVVKMVLLVLAAGGVSFIYGCVRIFFGGDPLQVVYGLRLTYLPLVFFFIGIRLGEDWAELEHMWKILVTVLAASALAGLVLMFVVPEYYTSLFLRDASDLRGWGLQSIAREGGLRMTGAMMDPVVFGTLCAWGVALSFSALFVARDLKCVFFSGFAFIVCLPGVILSLSRGAWFGAALATMICLLFNSGWFVSRRFCILVISFAALTAVVAEAVDNDAIFSILSRTVDKTISEGNEQREGQFDGVLENLPARPFGNGLGYAGHVGERFSVDGMTDAGYPHITDGWYLKLLAEGGVPLFLAFVAYLLCSFSMLFSKTMSSREPRQRALLSALLGIQTATLAQAMLSNVWDLYYLSQLLWLVGGLAASFRPASTQHNRLPTHAPQALSVSATAAAN